MTYVGILHITLDYYVYIKKLNVLYIFNLFSIYVT